MSEFTMKFKAQPDGSLTGSVDGISCVISPLDVEDTYSVTIGTILIVKATDDLEHAVRRCVAFAKELTGGIS